MPKPAAIGLVGIGLLIALWSLRPGGSPSTVGLDRPDAQAPVSSLHQPRGALAESTPQSPARSQAPAPPEVRPEPVSRNRPKLIEPTKVTAFGSVVAAEDGSPVFGAQLHWVSTARQKPFEPGMQGPPAATTDALGRFELTGHYALDPQALVTAEGRSPLLFQPSRWSKDGADDQVLRMQRGGTLRGTVEGIPPGSAPATVRLHCPSHSLTPTLLGFFHRSTAVHWVCSVGSDRRFELRDLPADVPLQAEVLLGTETLLKIPQRIAIRGGEVQTVLWNLGEAGQVRVRAQDPFGRPVAKADLALYPGSALVSDWIHPSTTSEQDGWTDSQGMLVFENVPPGDWAVGPNAGFEPKFAPIAAAFTVQAGAPPTEVPLTLHPGLTIRGQVLGVDGKPVQTASVYAVQPGRGVSNERDLHPDGRFVLGPLQAGTYQVWAAPEGRDPLVDSLPVEVEAGARNVQLRFRRGGTAVLQLVDGTTGLPCTGGIVQYHAQETGASHGIFAGQTGRVEVRGLAPGDHDFVGIVDDRLIGVLRSIPIVAGSEAGPLTIRVQPAGRVRVVHRGLGRAIIIVSQDGVRYGTSRVASGESALVTTLPGRVLIEVQATGNGPPGGAIQLHRKQNVLVTAGSEAEVVFEAQD